MGCTKKVEGKLDGFIRTRVRSAFDSIPETRAFIDFLRARIGDPPACESR